MGLGASWGVSYIRAGGGGWEVGYKGFMWATLTFNSVNGAGSRR